MCNNNSTIACTYDPHRHTKMKHIDLRVHFIRDCVNRRLIDVLRVAGNINVANIFTKPLARVQPQQGIRLLHLDLVQEGVLEDDPIEDA